MTIQIRGPDGAIIKFPDGTPQATMLRAVGMHYARNGQERAMADARANVAENNAGSGALGRTIRAAGQGALFGFGDELNGGINYLTTALANATGHGRGYSAAQGYQAARDAVREDMGQFHNAHPILDTGAQIAGGLASPGVGAAGSFVARGAGLANVAARGALAGGALGAAAGAGNAQGGLLSRLKGAGTGALAGAAAGAVVPVAAVGAAGLTNKVAAPVVNTVVRAANRASGGTLLNASRTASQRLTAAMQKDGLTPDMIRQAQTDWLQTGGVKPSTMDLIVKASPTNGQNTMGLLRGAAMKGAARGVAATNAQDIATNLQDNAIARTTALTPDARPAQQVQDGIAAQRSVQANTDYGAFKDTPVPVLSEPAMQALTDEPGQSAIAAARADAAYRMDTPQVSDLDRMAAGDFSQPFSAGSLDKVQRAYGETAGQLSRGGNNTRASGAMLRKDIVDNELSDIPGVQQARANYANASGQMDAIDTGRGILTAAPDQYAGAFTPEQAASAGVGARQAMTDAIGAQPVGATGTLNRISGATNMRDKLAATYGDDAAQSYQGAIGDMTAQLRNARFIDSGSNSATAGRLADDDSIIGHVPLTAHGMLASGINKIRSMSTLTDAEREALVRTGVTQDPEALDELLSKFLPPRLKTTTLGASYATPTALALTDQGQNQ